MATYTIDTRTMQGAASFTKRRIVRTRTGRLWCIYDDTATGYIYCAYSDDEGVTLAATGVT